MTFDNNHVPAQQDASNPALNNERPARDVDKTLHHIRTVEMKFYAREDGLYEVQGQLRDVKTTPFKKQLYPDPVPAGEPIHDIIVTLVLDETLLVRDLYADMRATPFGNCRQAQTTLAPLIGKRIERGWNRAVRDALGGAKSCTHIMEILGPMATTAYQGLAPKRMALMDLPENEPMRLAKVDSCFAYRRTGPVIAKLWPHLSSKEEAPTP